MSTEFGITAPDLIPAPPEYQWFSMSADYQWPDHQPGDDLMEEFITTIKLDTRRLDQAITAFLVDHPQVVRIRWLFPIPEVKRETPNPAI